MAAWAAILAKLLAQAKAARAWSRNLRLRGRRRRRRGPGPGGPHDDLQHVVLVARVRIGLARGTLPPAPEHVFASHGTGESCSVCERTITESHVQYEIDYASGPLRTHLDCYQVWVAESRNIGRHDGGSK